MSSVFESPAFQLFFENLKLIGDEEQSAFFSKPQRAHPEPQRAIIEKMFAKLIAESK